jgi:hypothetical protein
MAEAPAAKAVSWPTDEEVSAAFTAYVSGIGKVAHAWNYLMESTGRLFVIATGMERRQAAAIWYSTDADRVLLHIFKAAVLSAPAKIWGTRDKAGVDLSWFSDRVLSLHDHRNDAVHAPCSLVTDSEGSAMIAHPLSGHRRAKKLAGKELLVEFDWCERWAESLSRFSRQTEQALLHGTYPWPNRPAQPNRRRSKDLLPQHQSK